MPKQLPAWVHPPNQTWSGPKGDREEHYLECPECGSHMRLRKSKKYDRPFYGCSRWPDCDGTHGAHPDGAPLGVPADKVTKSARMRAHEAFDQLWKGDHPLMTRAEAYSWLESYFDMGHDEAHIGRFSREQCEAVVAAMLTEFDIEV